MANLLFYRPVASFTKEASTKLEVNLTTVSVVGGLLAVFIVLAIVLYTQGHSDAGRAVIDLAVVFLGWVAGRASGENSALKKSG